MCSVCVSPDNLLALQLLHLLPVAVAAVVVPVAGVVAVVVAAAVEVLVLALGLM